MIAFFSDGKDCIKAYRHGNDWQLISESKGERWFSVWEADKKASLHHAFNSFSGRELKRNQIAGMADKIY